MAFTIIDATGPIVSAKISGELGKSEVSQMQAMALGGIYLGGGIAPKIRAKLAEGAFINTFRKKGRLGELMDRIPIRVILNEKAALLGAARFALVYQERAA